MSKTVVVTGCSSGIGLAAAKQFALKGYKVIAGARRLEPMRPLEAYGVKIIELDVTSEESIQKLKKLIEGEYNSKVLYLFNNAGQSCTFPCIDPTYDQIKQCYDVNVFGAIRLTSELAPFVINAKGTIGFTGSVSGLLPFPFSGIYSSTKAAIHSYASCLAFELEPFNVKVINIVTGGVHTNIADTRPLRADSLYQTEGIEDVLSKRREMAVRNNPMNADVYAQKVVLDFENSKIGIVNKYRGHFASVLHFFSFWPRWIILAVFKKQFGLLPLWANLKRKYA